MDLTQPQRPREWHSRPICQTVSKTQDFHGILLCQHWHDSKDGGRCKTKGTFVAAPVHDWRGLLHKT